MTVYSEFLNGYFAELLVLMLAEREQHLVVYILVVLEESMGKTIDSLLYYDTVS